MLTAQCFDFYQYEDKTIDVTVTNSAGVVQDVAGWAVTFTIREPDGDLPSGFTALTVGSGITLPNPTTNGILRIRLSSAVTGNLPVGVYNFDVVRTDSGSETEVAIGMLTVNRQYRL